MSVHIIVTGGTIDKVHNPITEKLEFDGKTHVRDILKQCSAPQFSCDLLMLKDSLDINDTDREYIYDHIEKQSKDKIVITHGTSTMPETAAYLQERVQGKTVILTGAMRPFSLLKSDAEFNFGGAIIAAQTLSHGVYIIMNGQVFTANDVIKNTNEGRFETK